MTRKDYIKFAAMLNEARHRYLPQNSEIPTRVLDYISDELADILAADNARFDRDRFDRAARGMK